MTTVLHVTSQAGKFNKAAFFPSLPNFIAGPVGPSGGSFTSGSFISSGSSPSLSIVPPGSYPGDSWNDLLWSPAVPISEKGSFAYSALPSSARSAEATYAGQAQVSSAFYGLHTASIYFAAGRDANVRIVASGCAGQVPAGGVYISIYTSRGSLATYNVGDGTFDGPFTVPNGGCYVYVSIGFIFGTTSTSVVPPAFAASVTFSDVGSIGSIGSGGSSGSVGSSGGGALDWSALAWPSPVLTLSGGSSGTFTPASAHGDRAVVTLYPASAGQASSTAYSTATVTAPGLGESCNIHLITSGMSAVNASAVIIKVKTGPSSFFTKTLSGAQNGTVDIPFSMQNTLGVSFPATVYVYARQGNGGAHMICDVTIENV